MRAVGYLLQNNVPGLHHDAQQASLDGQQQLEFFKNAVFRCNAHTAATYGHAACI
jgi:hypothetical protein